MSKILPIQVAIEAVGSQSELARRVGVSPQAVHAWTRGGVISPQSAVRIESATNGAVTRAELRPDIFGPIDDDPGRGAA
ncbi:Cro/CI family transcriptional regulator [Candidatus Igneacidithiobacillus taiwanensis]|uniref:transcriptional regulator n=1 Tax=Candidatus Igneacidithiobacillus taiwanensis TaxID=1945924 RepID=UPI0028A09DCD|nr:Cro/CI family transcriptional regulator [Candidatus Igneacidithiobacillus taiwanensis]